MIHVYLVRFTLLFIILMNSLNPAFADWSVDEMMEYAPKGYEYLASAKMDFGENYETKDYMLGPESHITQKEFRSGNIMLFRKGSWIKLVWVSDDKTQQFEGFNLTEKKSLSQVLLEHSTLKVPLIASDQPYEELAASRIRFRRNVTYILSISSSEYGPIESLQVEADVFSVSYALDDNEDFTTRDFLSLYHENSGFISNMCYLFFGK